MNEEIWKRILSYIDDHIREKIDLAVLAELAGYSPFYFSRLFSETMGMPVTGYIRIRRLQYAAASLAEGKKVLEVSLMYAFDSHKGFTRSFRQLFGSPPSRARKFLTSYKVPPYKVPDKITRRNYMEAQNPANLKGNMHQLVFEVLRESLEEARKGYCTEIIIELKEQGKIRISDNGRGIPLSDNPHADQEILKKILDGRPITSYEYGKMGDFTQIGMQTVNSLCESLQVKVYRKGMCYCQDYIRGIPQHELYSQPAERENGTEITLKPDTAIFGKTRFQEDRIRSWIKANTKDLPSSTPPSDTIIVRIPFFGALSTQGKF